MTGGAVLLHSLIVFIFDLLPLTVLLPLLKGGDDRGHPVEGEVMGAHVEELCLNIVVQSADDGDDSDDRHDTDNDSQQCEEAAQLVGPEGFQGDG